MKVRTGQEAIKNLDACGGLEGLPAFLAGRGYEVAFPNSGGFDLYLRVPNQGGFVPATALHLLAVSPVEDVPLLMALGEPGWKHLHKISMHPSAFCILAADVLEFKGRQSGT